MLPFWERCCCGSLGILEVSLLRAGCLSATGSFSLTGSLFAPLPLELSLSDPDREDKEFLRLADQEDDKDEEEDDKEDKDEEAATEPPFKTSVRAFCGVLESSQVFWECPCVLLLS